MTPNRIIAVDVDEVCADLLTEWLRRYNRRWADSLCAEDIVQWSLTPQVKPECGNKIYDILHEDDLYEDVMPIYGARDAVEILRARGRVVFVTACAAGTSEAKLDWLVRWGFLKAGKKQPNYVSAFDKSLVRSDILIDDKPDNLKGISGLGILITHPHNEGAQGFRRAASLLDAAQRFSELTA